MIDFAELATRKKTKNTNICTGSTDLAFEDGKLHAVEARSYLLLVLHIKACVSRSSTYVTVKTVVDVSCAQNLTIITLASRKEKEGQA